MMEAEVNDGANEKTTIIILLFYCFYCFYYCSYCVIIIVVTCAVIIITSL